MTIDLDEAPDLARLARHRPTDHELREAWTQQRQTEVLDRILRALDSEASAVSGDGRVPIAQASGARRLHGRRRLGALVGVAAAVAVAVSVGPALLSPSSLPSAGAIDRLAEAAARAHALVIPDGKYLHLVVEDQQRGGGESANGTRTLESWTGADGHVWRKDTENGRVTYLSLPALGGGPVDLSPRAVASLPTDPSGLLDFLQSHVEGSTSNDEAVFVAVGDMTRMGYTPPAVRAAAIQALGRLPEVSATEADAQVTLTFADERARPGVRQSLVFDAATTQLVAEQLTGPDLAYSSQTVTSEVVDSVPARVTSGATDSPVKEASGSAGPST